MIYTYLQTLAPTLNPVPAIIVIIILMPCPYLDTPDPPTNVTLGVADSTTLMVRFSEPQQHNGAIVTRYRVQWSKYSDFSNITG